MTPEEYIALYEKNARGECSPEEQAALANYKDQFMLTDQPWPASIGEKEEVKRQILKNIHDQIKPKKTFVLRKQYIAAAALVIVVAAAGLIFNLNRHPAPGQSPQPKIVAVKDDVLPGRNKATLIVDGKPEILLDEVKSGLLVKQGNISIEKQQDGRLVYSNGTAGKEVTGAAFNQVITPRGGQYQLVLADGTRVWLNAASSLRFPVAFSGASRVVQLDGEAYFEVAKNAKMPFIVKTRKMDVDVLGTHFNVSAYADEEAVSTTLLEGSVSLSGAGKKALLKPGEQAVLGASQQFKLSKVDVAHAIAWKNGYFVFDNENIESIMRKVSRWYDVQVIYQGNIDQKEFGGTVSRSNSVASVLKSLELTGTVHFKKEGRRIIVMP